MEISIQIHDFKQNLTKIINESHLPLSVVNEIFLNFATQISALAEQEYQQALKKGGNDGTTTDST